MRPWSKIGFVVVGLGLVASVAACAVSGEDAESSASDFSHGRPRDGRRPVEPILAEEDASPPVPPSAGLIATDAEAPPVAEEDASADEPPPADEDAGTTEAPSEPPADPPSDEDAGLP